jgi:hypothetical protein
MSGLFLVKKVVVALLLIAGFLSYASPATVVRAAQVPLPRGVEAVEPAGVSGREVVLVVEYQSYWINGRRSTGSGWLHADGTFQNSEGHSGRWLYQPEQGRILFQHEIATCNPLLVAAVKSPSTMLGPIFCTDGTRRFGAVSLTITDGTLPTTLSGDPAVATEAAGSRVD